MKNIILYTFFAILIASCLGSCDKDLGNYKYHTINTIGFQNFDTVNGYTVLFKDTLTITPSLVMSQDQHPSPTGYTYKWSIFVSTNIYNPDSTVSTDQSLKIPINLSPGAYSLEYKVTDKSTGVTFQVRTPLHVTTDIYEGYLVMNDVNGTTRLDMLSYASAGKTFTQFTDVLKKESSSLPPQGQPYQVLCMNYTNSNITAQNYGIWIVTSTGTNRINQETFDWNTTYDVRYLMIGDVPTNFTAQRLTGELTYGIYPGMYMYAGGNIYSYSTFAGYAYKYTPLNVYSASGASFHVSPYVVTDGSTAVMYNIDTKNFVTTASYSSTTVTDVPASRNYPTGMDLVYMERNYANTCSAILKDPNTGKIYLLQFLINANQNYYLEITGTDIGSAEHFAVSPDLGYLFYNVGGKLYEYDLSLHTSFLMLDKGTADISYLAFQHFYNRLSNSNLSYRDWAKLLTVGSYDPASTPGSNGTLELYSIPPVNGQIQQTSQWTGLGKIVSVAYRER